MEDIELSPEAKRQVAALEATNERLLTEGMKLEARAQALEELTRRRENMVRRYQEFLAEIQTERQAIEAECQRLNSVSLSS